MDVWLVKIFYQGAMLFFLAILMRKASFYFNWRTYALVHSADLL